MGQVYEEHKDEDGFLYITYSGENTFGNLWTPLYHPLHFVIKLFFVIFLGENVNFKDHVFLDSCY